MQVYHEPASALLRRLLVIVLILGERVITAPHGGRFLGTGVQRL
jgi:hypothetical protein